MTGVQTCALPIYNLQPTVKFQNADYTVVTLQAQLSCGIYTVQKNIQLTDCADSCHIYVPSAFTPNNDGINDVMLWWGDCEPEFFHAEIYNRYGQLVFMSDNPQESWDGNFNSKKTATGIYVYKLVYKLPYQQKKVVNGTLNLIR